ncbi:MAG: hypothetical protein MUC62_06415 [Candidatus Thermoplasmatota archaeon]|jgi:hypothetical protein|nr:hypothetical protein [Candidatus Thermoplasmatota archaeon]
MTGARKRGRKTDSKTEHIASIFTGNPLKDISPKEISNELGYDIQLVTTLVNRLMSEGMVERTGRGRYKLKVDQVIDDSYLRSMISEMKDLTRMVLGVRSMEGRDWSGSGGFKELVELYQVIRAMGGSALANNILRLAAKKSLLEGDVEAVLGSVEEVALR